VSDLDNENLQDLIETKYHSVHEAIHEPGYPIETRTLLVDFQRHLFAASEAALSPSATLLNLLRYESVDVDDPSTIPCPACKATLRVDNDGNLATNGKCDHLGLISYEGEFVFEAPWMGTFLQSVSATIGAVYEYNRSHGRQIVLPRFMEAVRAVIACLGRVPEGGPLAEWSQGPGCWVCVDVHSGADSPLVCLFFEEEDAGTSGSAVSCKRQE